MNKVVPMRVDDLQLHDRFMWAGHLAELVDTKRRKTPHRSQRRASRWLIVDVPNINTAQLAYYDDEIVDVVVPPYEALMPDPASE